MQTPPFRAAVLPSAATWVGETKVPFGPVSDDADAVADSAAGTRLRLGEMDAHLHCSVIGTCLSTAELRKLMRRFIHVDGASDLELHHDAVRLASQNAEVARALHKALDRRHDASVQRFARATGADAVGALWQQSLNAGEVPGAYWALLTHRRSTAALRQQAFGDVHMLSHLVGAANRADIRRLVALEQDNAEWRERAERQQERLAELVLERDQALAERDTTRTRVLALEQTLAQGADGAQAAGAAAAATEALMATVAVQTLRREAAEAQTQRLQAEAARLAAELAHLQAHAQELGRELAAAEAELGARPGGDQAPASRLQQQLNGRRLLYVGGRPSSSAAIRELVQRHGGEYQRHDGGLEDRKGLLQAALAGADLVVFPVDCIDHDSALALKRHCQRLGKPFLPLRSASVTSFAAALAAAAEQAEAPSGHGCGGACLRHG